MTDLEPHTLPLKRVLKIPNMTLRIYVPNEVRTASTKFYSDSSPSSCMSVSQGFCKVSFGCLNLTCEDATHLSSGKSLGAGERKVHVGSFLHHQPSQRNGIHHRREARHCTASLRGSVHNAGLHLHCARRRQHGAHSSVEQRACFQ